MEMRLSEAEGWIRIALDLKAGLHPLKICLWTPQMEMRLSEAEGWIRIALDLRLNPLSQNPGSATDITHVVQKINSSLKPPISISILISIYLDNEATLARINTFLDDALRSSCEGIMVKSLDMDAGYTPSKRTDAWLKVKRDYVEGLSDSLDLVSIAAWYGNGRKAGWYSPFLMACYNPDRLFQSCAYSYLEILNTLLELEMNL